jgi:hypothetical protein
MKSRSGSVLQLQAGPLSTAAAANGRVYIATEGQATKNYLFRVRRIFTVGAS